MRSPRTVLVRLATVVALLAAPWLRPCLLRRAPPTIAGWTDTRA